MQYYGFDWLGTVFGLSSIYYTGRNDKVAFALRIAASLFWAAFGIVAHTPAAILANLAAILLCVRGLSLRQGRLGHAIVTSGSPTPSIGAPAGSSPPPPAASEVR